MRITPTLTATALVASAAALLAVLAATPASARPEPAPTPTPTVVQPADDDLCNLERVGMQFVRCDDLTGDGVPAPSYIPEPS